MINIAVIGFGVIGNGVVKIINENYKLIVKQINDDINVKYILDIRNFKGHELEHKIINDFDIVLNDPEISVIVEMIGGSHPAYEYSINALKAGKNVITSNKEVVANFGDELIRVANDNGVRYLFEASVGGGIPIIRPLATSLPGNDIYEINGILNGTSNYVLNQMVEYGKSLDEAIIEAKANGYAEMNPSADIDGIDTCRKICILSGLAFGTLVAPEIVSVKGIRDITVKDINDAAKDNCSIKLIGRAVKQADNKIYINVAPYAVRNDNPLSNINGVYNGILVKGNAVGDVMFYGQGAGSMPTASAVLSDIIDIAVNLNCQPKQKGWIKDISGSCYLPELPEGSLEETKYSLGTEIK